MTDIEILELSQKNPSVFGQIFDRNYKRFLSVAKSYLQSEDLAEDAVQNAFVKMYKYGGKFAKEGGDFKNWSNKILENCIKDEAKKRKVTVVMNEEIEEVLEAPSDFPLYESTNFLDSVFGKIDNMSAEVLKMRFLLGKSFKQIGKMLGISSGAARVRAYRAKKNFVEVYREVSGIQIDL